MINFLGGRSNDYIRLPRRGESVKRVGKVMDKNDKVVDEKPKVNSWGRLKERKNK